MVNNKKFIEKLSERLQRPLPGEKAQYLMAPASRIHPEFVYRYNSPPRLSSVLILLYQDQNQWILPMIERPPDSGVHSGQMALPGGKTENGDPDRIYTALRETMEETGVSIGDIEILGTLTELHIPASHNTVLPVVGYKPSRPEFHHDPGEVAALELVSMESLLEESNCSVTTIRISDRYEIEAPFYDINGKVVWGATAMILSEFLFLIREII